MRAVLTVLVLSVVLAGGARAAAPLDSELAGYDYPYPVGYFPFTVEGQAVRMAYMDVAPTAAANGRTVVLFHGKNFFGAYWRDTIAFLAANGYRVVVPDQLGFGKSSKPEIYYTFHLLAASTKQLLDSLGVTQAAVVGHSMGGMVAARFALMYPESVTGLVLENPLGLEDYKLAVPYASVDDLAAGEQQKSLADIRKYHEAYYAQWRPEYDEWVQVHYRWTLAPDFPRIARVNALTTQMVYTQPIVYELSLLRVPTLLVIGQRDRTALGKDRLDPAAAAKLGDYPALGRRTADAIPSAQLVELADVGHVPHFEAPAQFHAELAAFIGSGR